MILLSFQLISRFSVIFIIRLNESVSFSFKTIKLTQTHTQKAGINYKTVKTNEKK